MDNKPKYQELFIYYFSGTGNAKNAAAWIKSQAEGLAINSQLINIEVHEKIRYPSGNNNTLIGFCSPTHGFNMPPITLDFIYHFPKIENTDVFILNTRGGLKLSKLFLPGLSGIAQIFPAFLLMIKGFKIIALQSLDLPSNWLILHPGLKQKVILSIYDRCETIIQRFSMDILMGKRKYKGLWSLPIDILLMPIAIAYYLIGRFFLAKTLVATQACNQCGKCIKECPVKAISMKEKHPYWSFKCESCMRCVNHCPQRAIETSHGYILSLILLSTFIISPAVMYLLQMMDWPLWFSMSALTKNLCLLLYSALFLIIVFITHRWLHYCLRFKYFNCLIKYTSLSSYTFWRRYRPPKVG